MPITTCLGLLRLLLRIGLSMLLQPIRVDLKRRCCEQQMRLGQGEECGIVFEGCGQASRFWAGAGDVACESLQSFTSCGGMACTSDVRTHQISRLKTHIQVAGVPIRELPSMLFEVCMRTVRTGTPRPSASAKSRNFSHAHAHCLPGLPAS